MVGSGRGPAPPGPGDGDGTGATASIVQGCESPGVLGAGRREEDELGALEGSGAKASAGRPRRALLVALCLAVVAATATMAPVAAQPAPAASAPAPSVPAAAPEGRAAVGEPQPDAADAEAAPTLTVVGEPFAPESVAPLPTSPLSTPVPIKRDCGFSVELTNGRALWIFCDSTNVDADRRFTYFFQNTAAIAYGFAPTTLFEAIDGQGRPYQLIDPVASYDPCVGVHAGDRHVIWPTSATRVPGSFGRDRVLIYYTNYCYERGSDVLTGFEAVSMGVADLLFDPNQALPHTTPLKARVLNPNLWEIPIGPTGSDGWFGEAATFGFDSFVYLYRCKELFGCQVARAPYSAVGDPAAYQYWDGTSAWVPDVPATPTMPMWGRVPHESFNVVHLDDWGVWAMGSMSAPGVYSDKVTVRVARTPTGPWSAPIEIADGPDCTNRESCYAGNVHSQLSGPDSLGVSVYDLHHYHQRGGQIRAFGARVYLDPPPPGTCYSGFSDVPHDHLFCGQIRWFAQQGITTGYLDGTFRPSLRVSRQAMAAWFYRASGSPPGPFPDPGFTDLAPGDPFYEEIAWFAQQGITSGFADGEYKPRLSVSRQAMSSWFYRWSSSPPGPFPDPGFSDVAEGDLFYRSISWFAQAGITEGYTDGTFRPTAFVTRQTISAFFQRYLTGA